MTMKKKLLTTLSVVLILGLAALGILAYLTDTDSDVNVMTLGNVDIEQTEYQLNDNNELIPFEQNKPLYPNTSIDKIVKVKNVGESNAYVRTWFAFEAPVEGVIEPAWANGIDAVPYNDGAVTTIDGEEYVIYVVTYDEMNTTSDPVTSLEGVKMKATATNADVAQYGDTYEVLVFSQAGQVNGFESVTAKAALDTMFGSTHPWDDALASTPAEAQDALDNAKAGDVIQLAPGVNYGTLLLRPVDGNANTTTSLNEADGEGLTVYRNEYIRKVENLTIIGAPGAKVDAIKVVAGYIEGSGSSCNLVDVKGLVIDSVEFTDKANCAPQTYSAPIFFNLTSTDVDGLTVKNCKLIGNNDKVNLVYFTIDESSAFDGVASNVTLTGNTVDSIARLCELRQTENVTITDNVIKNTVLHGMLLTVHNGSYTGNVTITDNTADGIGNRFVRMSGASDAVVVIKNNTITNYLGSDNDYIKVTDSTGTPVIENNPMSR